MRQPLCRNPEHPSGRTRDSMILIEEKEDRGYVTHFVWGCTICRDVNKVLAVQVISNPKFREAINNHPQMKAYKRARLVERDPTNGRIKYFK